MRAAVFHEWVNASPFWRKYVFKLLGDRLATVLARLEETNFDRVDGRLARWFLRENDQITASHQELAGEIGTAREVVSRVLARWRRRGWVATGRQEIKVLDRAALASEGGLNPAIK